MDTDPYEIPFPRSVAEELIGHFFDHLIAWKLPNNMYGVLGVDADMLEAYLGRKIVRVNARYESGEITEMTLITKGVWEHDIRPALERESVRLIELDVQKGKLPHDDSD